jgi:hypothetical protein
LTEVQKAAVAIVMLPPALVFVGWAGLLAAAGVSGRHPIWNIAPANLAEAAAFRDPAAIVRLVRRGESINRPARVRAGIGTGAAELTPVEAAVAAGDSAIVSMLFNLGAAPDRAVWQRAWCASETASVREALERGRPPGVVAALCP